MKPTQCIPGPQQLEDFPYKRADSYAILRKLRDGRRNFDWPSSQSGKKGIVLYGPNGTGKSTLANLLPSIFETSPGFLSTPEAGRDGIISDVATYVTSQRVTNSNAISLVEGVRGRNGLMGGYSAKGWRYEIIDEASQLTSHAQGALKALMDAAHCTVFIFVTNDEHGFDGGLKSRCYCIEMGYASMPDLLKRAQDMLIAAGVTLNSQIAQKAHRIAQVSGGDLRELYSGVGELLGDIRDGN